MFLMAAMGCLVAHEVQLVPISRPTASAVLAADTVTARACNVWLLHFIPTTANDHLRLSRLLDELTDDNHGLVGVTVDNRRWVGPLASAGCTIVTVAEAAIFGLPQPLSSGVDCSGSPELAA